jgi:hypothetical protein
MSYAGCRSHTWAERSRHSGRDLAALYLPTRVRRAPSYESLPVAIYRLHRPTVSASLPAGYQVGSIAPGEP